MNTRKLVSAVALSAALMLGTTGCSLTHNVESLKEYAPSDGSQVNIGDLKIRNLIALSKGTETGQTVLIGSIVNSGTEDHLVIINPTNAADRIDDLVFNVKAGQTLSFGNAGPDSAVLLNSGFEPGSNTTLFIWVDQNTSANPITVPVLEDKPEQYAQFFQG